MLLPSSKLCSRRLTAKCSTSCAAPTSTTSDRSMRSISLPNSKNRSHDTLGERREIRANLCNSTLCICHFQHGAAGDEYQMYSPLRHTFELVSRRSPKVSCDLF